MFGQLLRLVHVGGLNDKSLEPRNGLRPTMTLVRFAVLNRIKARHP